MKGTIIVTGKGLNAEVSVSNEWGSAYINNYTYQAAQTRPYMLRSMETLRAREQVIRLLYLLHILMAKSKQTMLPLVQIVNGKD